MRNRSILNIMVMAALLLLASCEFRPLYVEGETPVEVLVITDWTQLGAAPAGSSIYFYPESGGKPWTFKTNSVAKTTVMVPSGYYTVMVFNRTVDEYGSMTFDGMDTLGRAHALLEDRLFPWVGRADTVGRTVYEPEEIVVGRTDHFKVRTTGERTYRLKGDSDGPTISEGRVVTEIDSVEVVTKRVVYTGNVGVRIKGIHNIRSMRGYLTGMAGAEYLASRTPGDTLATHVLERWSMERDATDYTKGYMRSTFSCFGLPEQYLNNRKRENNRLVLEFRLVDDYTELQYVFNVGDIIQQIDKTLEVLLTVEIDDHGNAIEIPDVVPSEGSESGFDVTLNPWEDPVDVPISI